jgi:NAD(P)H-hydrate repair Nnr-like enzyme with NAD(P)H-hydrate dehydratase domain
MRKDEVLGMPEAVACRRAAAWRAVVTLKGATTWIASAHGSAWRHVSECAGLATSGSGDVLAGLVAGLAARGATPEQAAVWGVALHARAGEALVRQQGGLGFLARELAAEVPGLMHRFVGLHRQAHVVSG